MTTALAVDPALSHEEAVAPKPQALQGAKSGTDPGSIRGPLKYEIETSSPALEAGRSFSIYIRITNPYDVPVRLQNVSVPVPVEFQDIENDSPGLLPRASLARNRRPGGSESYRVAVARNASRTGGLGGSRPGDQGIAAPEIAPGPSAADTQEGDRQRTPEPAIEIQPGNTFVKLVSFVTTKSILFTPAVYNLEAQIEYRMDGKDNHDAVKMPVNIKAPLAALVVGAAVGATAGNLFRDSAQLSLFFGDFRSMVAAAVSILLSVVLSTIVIVAFARKKDAQPFMSVEDFYGGLFVGFLVGYNGDTWLRYVVDGGSGAPTPTVPK